MDRVETRLDKTPEIYVRKDVYQANQRADTARWAEHDKDHETLNKERDSDATFRRQVLLWGAGLTITTLVTVGLFVASIMLGKI